MPVDFAYDGRDFECTGANIKVKYRNSSGVLVSLSGKAAVLADTALHAKIDMSADTVEAIKTGYTNGAAAPHDEDGNAYKTTWTSGKALKYDTTDLNTNLFTDLGPTP